MDSSSSKGILSLNLIDFEKVLLGAMMKTGHIFTHAFKFHFTAKI